MKIRNFLYATLAIFALLVIFDFFIFECAAINWLLLKIGVAEIYRNLVFPAFTVIYIFAEIAVSWQHSRDEKREIAKA